MTDTASDDLPLDEPPSEMGEALYEQILELWVEPEIEARVSAGADRSPVQYAVVVMEPDQPVRVLINDEAHIVAEVEAKGAIDKGEMVTTGDIAAIRSLQPHQISRDAGWALFMWIGGRLYVAFDFRRYRATANKLLELARAYSDVASVALSMDAQGPAILNAFAAAELAVKAQMLVFGFRNGESHRSRQSWMAQWTRRLGNAPQEHSSALGRLAELSSSARYGGNELRAGEGELRELLETVGSMVTYAEIQVGPTGTMRE